MGGRSSGGSRNTAQSASERLEGQSIEALREYSYYGQEATDKLVEDFGLEFANRAQIESLKRLLRGVLEYDRGYDENKTPWDIVKINIERLGTPRTEEEKKTERAVFGRALPELKDISVSMYTEPHTDNAYIRMMDEKYRRVIIGNKGGYYTFDNKGKRKTIKEFDAQYGKRSSE